MDAGGLPEHDDSLLHLLLVIPAADLQEDCSLLFAPTPRKNGRWAEVSLVYLEDWAAFMTKTREKEGKEKMNLQISSCQKMCFEYFEDRGSFFQLEEELALRQPWSVAKSGQV